MDIDIERLKTDAAYWDEVAPAGATHYAPGRVAGWYKRGCDIYWFLEYKGGWDKVWPERFFTDRRIIPRPTKPAAPDWDGEGYPPVGCGVKVWFNSAGAGYWQDGTVIAQDGNMTVVKVNGAYYGRKTGGELMRPIRTKEQRQRDELAELCNDYIKRDDYGQNLAEAIIAAGWKKDA